MGRILRITLVAAAFALAGFVNAAYADPVTNGEFGYPNSANLNNWNTVGTFYDSLNGVVNGITQLGGTTPTGNELQLGNDPGNGPAGVSQTLTTAAGQNYNLSLYWGTNASNASGNELFQVLWDNAALENVTVTPSAQPWEQLSFSVRGTGSDTLTIQGYSYSGYNYVADISGANSSIPEPCTLLLLGSGLAGLVGFRKKFQAA